MGLPLDFLISALVTLLVVVDPVGLIPAFLGVTAGLPPQARRSASIRACLIAFAILTGAALVGDWLLDTLSISLPAFRIAGGLLLFSIASEMVFDVRITRQSATAATAIEEQVSYIAAFPLAIPLMAGPGAITATVLLSGRAGGDMARLAVLIGIIAAVMVACLLVFLAASGIERMLGKTGNTVLSRLLGVLLAAMAVQFVVDGVKALWG
jgi:multiple antibiotic resistance protein